MNYIEFDDSTITFGDASVIIYYKDEKIANFEIPTPNLGEKYKESINSTTGEFLFKNIRYHIDINSSSVGTYITIESDIDSNEIGDFEIQISFLEDYYKDLEDENMNIDFYTPCLPFTGTTSAVLYELADNKKVIPIIDISTEDKLIAYNNDEMIDYKHFLDISSIMNMTNKKQRDEVKEKRKNEKKTEGKMITPIPKPQYKFINNIQEKISLLKNLDKKKYIIPIFKWNDRTTLDEFKTFIRQLVPSTFENIAIRVESIRSFFENIKDISEIKQSYIFLDLNTNYDIEKIKKLINKIQEYNFKHIIYLGAQFNPEDMSISQENTNTNILLNNNPLLVFDALKKDIHNLWYGDYCGVDRKTITELPSGGRPTARVILSSLDNSKKILIRRGWDETDATRDIYSGRITRLGYRNSMKVLLKDVQEGILDKQYSYLFMDKDLCDADFSLKDFFPDITTPGIVKTLCLRHNIFSIIHSYITTQENP